MPAPLPLPFHTRNTNMENFDSPTWEILHSVLTPMAQCSSSLLGEHVFFIYLVDVSHSSG